MLKRQTSRVRRRPGLSMVEALVSLAISALLLTAVAAAFSASSSAIENNDQFFRATQAGRISLAHMITEIRRCTSLAVYSDHIDLTTDDDVDYTFKYDSASQRLLLIANDQQGHPQYALAENVTSVTFDLGAAMPNNVQPVAITVVVAVQNNQIRLAGSAVPRCEIRYH